jgi:hypothetical protein
VGSVRACFNPLGDERILREALKVNSAPALSVCFICRSSDWVAELVRQVQVDLGYELVRQVAVDVPAGSLMCMFALWDC